VQPKGKKRATAGFNDDATRERQVVTGWEILGTGTRTASGDSRDPVVPYHVAFTPTYI